MLSSSENEACPFVLSGKTSPITGKDNEDSYVGKENPPDSKNCAEDPPANKNGAGAVAETRGALPQASGLGLSSGIGRAHV